MQGATGATGAGDGATGAAGSIFGTSSSTGSPWTSPPISITRQRSGNILLNGFVNGQNNTGTDVTLTVIRDVTVVGSWTQGDLGAGPTNYQFIMPVSLLDQLTDFSAHSYTMQVTLGFGEFLGTTSYGLTAAELP